MYLVGENNYFFKLIVIEKPTDNNSDAIALFATCKHSSF